MQKKQETIGTIFALGGSALWGVFPVLVNKGTQYIPPMTFAAITTLLAACCALVYAAVKGDLHELKKKESYASLIMITLWSLLQNRGC